MLNINDACLRVLIFFFFFFQAEDGIRDPLRDWSSDVCSSDLQAGREEPHRRRDVRDRRRSRKRRRQEAWLDRRRARQRSDRKSTRLNSSHVEISYAVFCLKKKKKKKKKKRKEIIKKMKVETKI